METVEKTTEEQAHVAPRPEPESIHSSTEVSGRSGKNTFLKMLRDDCTRQRYQARDFV